jgi:hypothetical protein
MHAGNIVGSIGDGASYGTAFGHIFDSTSSCVDCHENGTTLTYFSDFGGANGHQVVDHDGLTGVTSSTPIYDCNHCHANSTKNDIASVVHNTALCADCHTSSGDLVGAVSNGTTLNHVMGQTSNCNECHGTYAGDFETHIYANNTTDHIAPPGSGSSVLQLAGTDAIGGTPCDACHGSTLTDWANVYDLHDLGSGGCVTCHNSTREGDTDFGLGVQDLIHDNQSTNPCISCHVSKALDHSDHVATFWVTGNTECTSCHDQTDQNNQTQMIDVIHSNGAGNPCALCHFDPDGADYTLIGSAANNRIPEDNAVNTCNTCHDSRSGKDYASDFTEHLVQDHDGVTGTTSATLIYDCNNCHIGDIIASVHNPDCTDCHNNSTTDGSLIIGANSQGTALGHSIGSTSNCLDCHEDGSTYTYGTDFETHIYGSTTDHYPGGSGSTVFQLAGTDQIGSDPCDKCHGSTLTDWANVYALHDIGGTGACATCHNATRDDTDAGGVQYVIHANDTTNPCISCHVSKSTDHADHVVATWVTGYTECDGCHDQSVGNQAQLLNEIHGNGVTADCTLCHPGGGDYTLKAGSSAEGHENGPNTCVTCHSAYQNAFGSAHTPDHKTEALADAVTSTPSCTANCHSGDMITAVHTPDCLDCHTNTTTDGRLRVGANSQGTALGHAMDSTSSCADCHEDGSNYTYASDFDNMSLGHRVQDHTGIAG